MDGLVVGAPIQAAVPSYGQAAPGECHDAPMPADTWEHHSWLYLAACFALAVLAVGRAARLLTHDDFPPAVWWRVWWANHTGRWADLFGCPWCMSPWLAGIDLGWAWWSGLDWTRPWGAAWLLANTWFALAYAAAITVAYDERD